MTEIESPQASSPEHKPTTQYSVGDIVTLIHNASPDVTTYVLIGPFEDTIEGPRAKAMQLDDKGRGVTDGGTVDPDNIKDVIGQKTQDETVRLYEALLIDKYNDTLPEDVVARLAAEAIAGSSQ